MIRTLLTAVLPLASLGLMAVEGLTPDTIFDDIPGDATIREIVTTGGGGGSGGADTNAVIGLATDLLTKTNAVDFANASPSSVVGRVTNEDVRLHVSGGKLSILDRDTTVWVSGSSGANTNEVIDIALDVLMKTNAEDLAESAAPSSLVARVTNKDIRLHVDNGNLLILDKDHVVWSSGTRISMLMMEIEALKERVTALENK